MESTAFCKAAAEAGLDGTVSFAGRVDRPVRQPLPQRVGGFGGAAGLAEYIRDNAITHVIDATHPFAAQMSTNAVEAAKMTGVPLIALTRAPWVAQEGDNWTHVPDIEGAVGILNGSPRRVMLAVGRMHLAEFAPNPQHFYLLRLVDPPKDTPPFPDHHVLVSRGPFTTADDTDLMRDHNIDLVVSKNAGGKGAYAKIEAARALGLPVIMIGRPDIPARPEVSTPGQVLDWIRTGHLGTDRGV